MLLLYVLLLVLAFVGGKFYAESLQVKTQQQTQSQEKSSSTATAATAQTQQSAPSKSAKKKRNKKAKGKAAAASEASEQHAITQSVDAPNNKVKVEQQHSHNINNVEEEDDDDDDADDRDADNAIDAIDAIDAIGEPQHEPTEQAPRRRQNRSKHSITQKTGFFSKPTATGAPDSEQSNSDHDDSDSNDNDDDGWQQNTSTVKFVRGARGQRSYAYDNKEFPTLRGTTSAASQRGGAASVFATAASTITAEQGRIGTKFSFSHRDNDRNEQDGVEGVEADGEFKKPVVLRVVGATPAPPQPQYQRRIPVVEPLTRTQKNNKRKSEKKKEQTAIVDAVQSARLQQHRLEREAMLVKEFVEKEKKKSSKGSVRSINYGNSSGWSNAAKGNAPVRASSSSEGLIWDSD
ncbi:hypothetical protein GQ42DRAFT_56377 [Ramicandelaber brevisporus]|nr:hypothetical protein GQ42DRAFT_56377 [Ramicandelaber brevisporus]